jgi:hypothetical protein
VNWNPSIHPSIHPLVITSWDLANSRRQSSYWCGRISSQRPSTWWPLLRPDSQLPFSKLGHVLPIAITYRRT